MIPTVTPQGLRLRRFAFLLGNVATYFALLAALADAVGFSVLGVVVIACAAAFLPWSVLGFWNGAVGLVLLFARRRAAGVAQPITLRTAVVMTLRNEDPARALGRLRIVQASLDATGAAGQFAYFVLSDSSDPDIAAREAAEMAAWQAGDAEPGRISYRRRADNVGYKAGNVMDFCDQQGAGFDLMLALDADSLMSGEAILDLVRIMQADPGIGIVQGLVVGLPARSVFARMFQFGMRHGMRSFTVGQAWWTHDCGPFWGHNAILRIAPFRAHCRLPVLSGAPPFGGHILSHDQVEAVLMRRAGYTVRLQSVAGGSWEDNPPTMLDYIHRDTRWCQGNLQYVRLIGMRGLQPVSRFQLLWAILMFGGIPAWTLLMALLPLAAWVWRDMAAGKQEMLVVIWWIFLLMYLAPKLAGYIHTAASLHRRSRYGGLGRMGIGALCEIVFSLLQSSIASFNTACFIASLLLGHSTRWGGQARDARAVSWAEAARAFWPQTLFGVAVNLPLMVISPALLMYALPFTLGYLVAIPFAVVTASPALGRWSVRMGLCAVPEEASPPVEVAALMSV